ncbi:hypothetical protein HC024_12925 [Methylococcaceae bacterium WWC4]|nr:hypothetical protein [Methylococcaceae bacterium WWC4]
MNQSAQEKAKANQDPVVKQEFEPAKNNSHREAFKDEALKIEERGGVDSEKLYNIRNSPGKTYLEEDGQ